MSSVILTGDTSGTLTVSAPLVAGSNTLTLAAATGTLSPLVSATAVASTSGTSIDFTGIPSWAKRVTVMFNGVSTSGTSIPIIQLGTSGGIENTGYVGNVATTNTTSIGNTAFSTGFALCTTATAGAGNTAFGAVYINLLSTSLYECVGNIGYSQTPQISMLAGGKAISGALDRIRITTVGGTDTFDAGSINIMYEG
jgi:hypothetical protein